MSDEQTKNEWVFPFGMDTCHFIGRKAKAVYFGEERVEVRNWRGVYKLLLSRCYAEYPDDLMYLRNKAAGKVRTFLSDKPDGMVRPFQLAEELWADGGQYGTATLLHILRDCILRYTRFDCRDIRLAVQ
jgi:hypothetical protein